MSMASELGTCISGDDAILFFESIREKIVGDNLDIQEQFDRALNRFRYEVKKEKPIPPRIQKAKYRAYKDFVTCGNCGFSLNAVFKFCPNCGRSIERRRT